ncbi:class I SAM-dependent rRNA methyltransferase [bacterium]|nr:class I SAM-dependent rRNA methyltransferase [bacterium]
MVPAKVVINAIASQRLHQGYLWVLAHQIQTWPAGICPGDLVEVHSEQQQCLGYGYVNPLSQIGIRMLYTPIARLGSGIPDEARELGRKLDRARSQRVFLTKETNAWRLVWSEADGLPGLICDYYAPFLVVQFITQGMEKRKNYIVDWLISRCKPAGIYERSDGHGRRLEGLPAKQGWIWFPGEAAPEPETEIFEGPIKYRVNLAKGQKTGFYLDQRAARRCLREQKINGIALDVFANSGGFSLAAVWAGASQVLALDTSAQALAHLEQNTRLNRMQHAIHVRKENAFAYLSEAVKQKKKYSTIILDPPPFTRSKAELADAMRGYRELHRRASQLLHPQGLLLTCSCSHHVTRKAFAEIALQGVSNTGRKLKIITQFGPDRDHPEKSQLPESRYLNCILGKVI